MLDLNLQSPAMLNRFQSLESSSQLECLPNMPKLTIEARKPLALWPYLGELLGHWELLRFFVWRDLLIRYRRTLLGVSWVIFQPTLQACLLWWLLGAKVADNVYGPIQWINILTGTVLWLYGASTILGAIHQLSSNSHLITKVYFPRALLVLTPAIGHLLDLAVMSVVILAVVAIWGSFQATQVLLVLCHFGAAIACLGPALIGGALAARFRDIKHIAPYLMQLWFFCTPSIYRTDWCVSDRLSYVLGIINPLNCWVCAAQQALVGSCARWDLWLLGSMWSISWCFLGLLIFIRLEYNLADHM